MQNRNVHNILFSHTQNSLKYLQRQPEASILSFCPNMIFLEIDEGGGPHHINSISSPQTNIIKNQAIPWRAELMRPDFLLISPFVSQDLLKRNMGWRANPASACFRCTPKERKEKKKAPHHVREEIVWYLIRCKLQLKYFPYVWHS